MEGMHRRISRNVEGTSLEIAIRNISYAIYETEHLKILGFALPTLT